MSSTNNISGNQSAESATMPVPNASNVTKQSDKESMERVAEIWKDLAVQLDSGDNFVEIDDLVWVDAWGDFEKERVRELMM